MLLICPPRHSSIASARSGLDLRLHRSRLDVDLRSARHIDGLPLYLVIGVRSSDSGRPVAGLRIEVGHCDAQGRCADGDDPTYLRGWQSGDDDGTAMFQTIYPGWRPGLAVHVGVRLGDEDSGLQTANLFFDDAVSDDVHAQSPYAIRGVRDMRNDDDPRRLRTGRALRLRPLRGRPGYIGEITLTFPGSSGLARA